MLISKRDFSQFVLLLPLGAGAQSAFAQVAVATAINRAARFRALSQRCAKAYLQLQLDVLPESAQEILVAVKRLTQVGFDDLSKANLPAEATKLLNVVQQDSTALMTLVAVAPTRDRAIAVVEMADKLLASAERLTQTIEALASQTTAKLINLAGRQRMLSQRLAKNYMLTALGAETRASREQIAADWAAFPLALKTLVDAPISTPSIRNDLQSAQEQWIFFEVALNRKPDLKSLSNIATTSERLLEINDKLTVSYEAALKDLLGSSFSPPVPVAIK